MTVLGRRGRSWRPWRGRAGVGILQTGGINVHAGSIGFKPDRINPPAHQEPVFAARRLAAGQIASAGQPAAVFAVQRIARQLTLPPFSTTRLEMLGSDIYGLLVAAAWLLFGWSASTTWSSGRAGSRGSR